MERLIIKSSKLHANQGETDKAAAEMAAEIYLHLYRHIVIVGRGEQGIK